MFGYLRIPEVDSRIVTALVTGVMGYLGGLAKVGAEQRTRRIEEEEKQRVTLRLNYLDPLRVAGSDLLLRLREINAKITAGDTGEIERMYLRFHSVKHPFQENLEQFGEWANGEGYFAVSTIQLTAAFFFRVRQARQRLPLGTLKPGDDRRLLERLDAVRKSLSTEFGVWSALQDSIGDYAGQQGESGFTYERLCECLYSFSSRVWLLRVLDFYREIHWKRPEEREQIINAVEGLGKFLEDVTGILRPQPTKPSRAIRRWLSFPTLLTEHKS